MTNNMEESVLVEYRNLSGARSRALVRRDRMAVVRFESHRLIQRYGHELVLLFTASGIPDLFADWWFDLRRGQLRIWGGLLRYIDLAIASRRVPKSVLKMLPGILDEYIEQGFPGGA